MPVSIPSGVWMRLERDGVALAYGVGVVSIPSGVWMRLEPLTSESIYYEVFMVCLRGSKA